VVTLKERRVSLVGTTNNNRSKEREGRDNRKLEVKRLSDMGKGIRRKSAPAAVVSKAASNSTASDTGDGVKDKSGDLILKQQSKDTTTTKTTTIATTSSNTSNTSNIPNTTTTIAATSETIQKKVGGRPAKSRTSITNGSNVSNSLYQGAIINPLKCPHCSKDFLSEKGLQYHVGKFNVYLFSIRGYMGVLKMFGEVDIKSV